MQDADTDPAVMEEDTALERAEEATAEQARAEESAIEGGGGDEVLVEAAAPALAAAPEPAEPAHVVPKRGLVRANPRNRKNHLQSVLSNHKASVAYLDQLIGIESSVEGGMTASEIEDKIGADRANEILEISEFTKRLLKWMQQYDNLQPSARSKVEVRLHEVSFRVPVIAKDKPAIPTVYNTGCCYSIRKFFKKRREKKEAGGKVDEGPTSKLVLRNVNLVLKPGKFYLVLGPPASGKTTLLRAIAGLLPVKEKGPTMEGTVEYNGLSFHDKTDIVVSNAISFVDQIDRHAPRMTVEETFDFAFQCLMGGSHSPPGTKLTDEEKEVVKRMDENKELVGLTMEGIGIDHVADTFVGNADVRGVSGGQRRRVTLGEMMIGLTPIMCADEISTGLDAKSTFDICQIIMRNSKLKKSTRIISLLQPSPETFGLFDEVILLSEGYIIYAGPITEVVPHFANLGYHLPEAVDVADFLQTVATRDGAELFQPTEKRDTPYTPKEFAEAFQESEHAERIQTDQQSAHAYKFYEGERKSSFFEESGQEVSHVDHLKRRYQNPFWRSTWLNLKRHILNWRRDRRFLIANAIKNIIMGASVGAVFFDTDNAESIFGVFFQGMLFIMLGAMTSAPGQMSDRPIYYKHQDANFYPTFSYVIGQTIAAVPQAVMDVALFGTILYWMVGLEGKASNFFIFLAVKIVFNLVMNQMLGAFASVMKTKAALQGIAAFILLLLVLFCGFIVNPDVIPNYYTWIYWWNPLAWAYRALVLNEFTSDSYDDPFILPNGQDSGYTEGERLLISYGFTYNGQPFKQEWIGYCFAYLLPYIVLCVILGGLGLKFVRISGETGVAEVDDDEEAETGDETGDTKDGEDGGGTQDVDLPFIPVDLSFEDISYEVKSSTGPEKLKLLNNVNGVFGAGRMCALMGESGAGKTTLMDVIALRKQTGKVTGEVRLNGFPQEAKSFRRCSGYVYQFDVQQPELTVLETVLFSARLRLDSSTSDEDTKKFVDYVLGMLELTSLKDALVGSDEAGGLSFEQNKRLSIAVELAASPSVIFLDEPTSGLDSRAALIVMRALQQVTATGRTVCATIHQPSSAVFEMFDDLLLLKKGGKVVFFGELGDSSCHLIDYFEGQGAKPIMHGENPGTWMLTVLGENDATDYAVAYKSSDNFKAVQSRLSEIKEAPDEAKKITFEQEFATSFRTRNRLVSHRLQKIYWRSPAYNRGRVILSLCIAFILGSVFITNRKPPNWSETEMSSILSTMFISFIIIGVLSITAVLPVMLMIRDVFYKHRLAAMLDHKSVALGLASGEKMFIIAASTCFCCVFYFCMGFALNGGKFVAFWGFFTFNLAIYSYFGQAFMCCVRGMATAQILASVFIGINNFFSGLIVRPQYMTGIFQVTYWICPGHYVYEGMVASQFKNARGAVVANEGSDFWNDIGCPDNAATIDGCPENRCCGTQADYVYTFFGGKFTSDHIFWDGIACGIFLIVARLSTYFALKHFNYTST